MSYNDVGKPGKSAKDMEELEKRIQEGVKQHQANAEPGSPEDNDEDADVGE